MNIQNNAEFKKLFKSIKERYDVGGEEDNTLESDMHECIANMITAIELGRGDEAFAGLFLPKMNRIFTKRLPAMAAIGVQDNCVTLSMNPYLIFTTCNDYEDFKCVIQHEIYHLVFKHLISSRNYPNHDRTNIAMDVAVNQYINFTPTLNEYCYTLNNFIEKFKLNGDKVERKREFEYYYEMIPEDFNSVDNTLKQLLDRLDDLQKEQNSRGNSEKNESDKDQKSQDQENNSEGSNQGESSEDNNSSGNGQNNEQNNNDNNKQNIDKETEDALNKDPKSMSDSELQKSIDKIKEIIKNYLKNNYIIGDITNNANGSVRKMDQSLADRLVQQELLEQTLNEAKERGKIPGGMQSMIDNLYFKDPIISWKKELRHIIGSIPCPYKKTMRVKNRRQPNRADILGRVNDRKINVAVCVDTSGSVSDDELKYFFNELFNIIKDVKTEVTLIQCDASVNSCDKIKDKSDVKKVKINGRGGTCFEPAFKYIKEEIPKMDKPSVVIYFTDGYGESEINLKYKPAEAEILWILTGYDNNLSVKTPAFINKVRLLNIENKKYL